MSTTSIEMIVLATEIKQLALCDEDGVIYLTMNKELIKCHEPVVLYADIKRQLKEGMDYVGIDYILADN